MLFVASLWSNFEGECNPLFFLVVLFLVVEICGRLASVELDLDGIGLTQSSVSQVWSQLKVLKELRDICDYP